MNQNKLTDKSRKSKGTLQRQSLLDRLKLKELEQPKFIIVLTAGAFILYWLANVLASLMLMHFQPESGELALLISLLMTSLFTFTIAIVALIELLKFSYAGCSISIILSWANFALNVLLLIYTHYWLGACISLTFAISITLLLNSKVSAIKYVLGFLLLLGSFALILYPPMKYKESRALVEEQIAKIDLINPSEINANQDIADFVSAAKYLHTFARYFGENESKITLFSSYYALAVALEGKIDQGYKIAQSAVKYTYVQQSFVNKIKIYSMLMKVAYEDYVPKILTPEEYEAFQKKMTLSNYNEDLGSPEEDDWSDLELDNKNNTDDLSDLDQ